MAKTSPSPSASSGIASLLSADLVVTGLVKSDGEVVILGRVEGCVRAERIVIGDTGAVQGELLAARAEIHGVVMGSVAARDVALCVGSHVEADILQRTFSVASGARFTGRCSHGEMPASQVASVIKEANRLVSLSEQTLAEVVGG